MEGNAERGKKINKCVDFALRAIVYLESEKQLDGVGKRRRRWQTEPRDQSEEEEVEKSPGESQRGRQPSCADKNVIQNKLSRV